MTKVRRAEYDMGPDHLEYFALTLFCCLFSLFCNMKLHPPKNYLLYPTALLLYDKDKHKRRKQPWHTWTREY